MMDSPSKVKSAVRHILIDKRKRNIRPLSASAIEVKHLFPELSLSDIVNEIDALALADGCRISIDINKTITLLWQEI